MLRLETATGYWLITHPDHARLAGAFATRWGNDLFAKPRPRANVLLGIHAHDDGWAVRDRHPTITRAGKPSAFSQELVGSYSAFEEIDLPGYLAVRERAVEQVQAEDAYAALLVSMHTCNLLTAHADRSTIAPAQLPLLDAFLERQLKRQDLLRARIRENPALSQDDTSDAAILNNFRLLQACDNLSLLSCVAFTQPATLLHPLPTNDGHSRPVAVTASAPRRFHLSPYPFDEPHLTFEVPARHVEGHIFAAAEELERKFAAAKVEGLTIAVSP
jgi:hypothetical protein